MSRNVKIALAIMAFIGVGCCCAAILVGVVAQRAFLDFAETTLVEEPEEVARLGAEILDYELAAGYQENMGINLMGNKIVFISDQSASGAVIMLMQVSEMIGNEPADLERLMTDNFSQQQGDIEITFSLVEEEEMRINGVLVPVRTLEGTDNQSGQTMRQVTAVFTTKDGSVGQFLIFGSAENWPEADVDTFLNSLE